MESVNRTTFSWVIASVCVACSAHQHEEGLSVSVYAAGVEAADRAWTGDSGETIRIVRGYISLSDLEIVKCEQSVARWRWPSLISEAQAHTTSSPTKIGAPAVWNVLSDTQLAMGTLTPPPARYCSVKGHFGPADSDARSLPNDAVVVGKTFNLELTIASGTSKRNLTLEGSQRISFEVPVVIDVSETTPHASVILSEQASNWFRGVDFNGPKEKCAEAFAANLGANARIAAR